MWIISQGEQTEMASVAQTPFSTPTFSKPRIHNCLDGVTMEVMSTILLGQDSYWPLEWQVLVYWGIKRGFGRIKALSESENVSTITLLILPATSPCSFPDFVCSAYLIWAPDSEGNNQYNQWKYLSGSWLQYFIYCSITLYPVTIEGTGWRNKLHQAYFEREF